MLQDIYSVSDVVKTLCITGLTSRFCPPKTDVARFCPQKFM